MTHPVPDEEKTSQGPSERCGRAIAEAVTGLEAIRDEGPSVDPIYPDNGSVEDHENWGFDSASQERAQTAADALDRVAAIMKYRPPSS